MTKSTIGNRVVFSRNGRAFRGSVEDEVMLFEDYEDREFLDVIQYIKWDDGGHSIRFCYYVRERGAGDKDWIFANRPLSISLGKLEELLRQASNKNWFPIEV